MRVSGADGVVMGTKVSPLSKGSSQRRCQGCLLTMALSSYPPRNRITPKPRRKQSWIHKTAVLRLPSELKTMKAPAQV